MPDEGQFDQAIQWLEWAHSFLEARNLYHKKQAIKKTMMIKMAKTLLAPDELERIEAESETKAAAELDREGDA